MKFDDPSQMSLQDAFKKFREKRMQQIQATKKMIEKPLDVRADNKRVEWLRAKFLNQALKYLGVPYAKKYHEEGSPDYNAPLYLDCCALVRRVLKDMKNELGFSIGRWNQAYQFDTLPITINKEEDMKPGDLVFISGTYFKSNQPFIEGKAQKHNMVHVEIWLGDGEKTVGARYHKGRVQIHDSYKFVSKSYHSMKYHFKSIDTWLHGICRSFCSTHAWKTSKYLNHGKKSIFSNQADEESCGDSDDDDDDDDDADDDGSDDEEKQNKLLEHIPIHVSTEGKPSMRSKRETGSKQPLIDTDVEIGYNKQFSCSTECLAERCDRSSHVHEKRKESRYNNRVSRKEILLGKKQVSHTLIGFVSHSPVAGTIFQSNPDIWGNTRTIESMNVKEINRDSCPVIARREHDYYLPMSGNEFDEEQSLPETSPYESFSRAELEEPSCSCMSACDCCCNTCMLCNAEILHAESLGTNDGHNLPKACPSGIDAKQQKQNQEIGRNGNDLAGGKRQLRSRSKSPSKLPGKQCSVNVSSSSSPRRIHKAAPKFYIGGKNGVELVEKPLLEQGWQRIDDNKDLSYYLKWVECKSRIDYKSFRAGEQLVNHISNGGCLTTKGGLLKSLEDYARIFNRRVAGSSRKLELQDFYPETYKIENRADVDKFTSIFKDGETWICKPSGLNQGKGIFLLRSPQQLREGMQENSRNRTGHGSTTRIVSRYIESPLLLNGRKFDIRAYMLIASTTPYLVLYHSGYIRLACSPYSKDSPDLATHLTNQYVQKKHPDYSEKKDDSIWTFEKLNNHINVNYQATKGVPDDWVLTDMTDRIKEIMLICFRSVEHKLERKSGYFDLLGFDFMIDDNMKIWLIEINVNPALFTNCEPLRQVLPGIVEETVKISVEAFENRCSKKKVHPLESMKTFEILYDEERRISYERSRRTKRAKRVLDETDGSSDTPESVAEESKAIDRTSVEE